MKVTTGDVLRFAADEGDFRRQFERLYFDHVDALFQYGAKFRANQELVEDCVQELFADLWEDRDTLSTVKSVRSYLLGALRRKILRKIYTNHESPLETEDIFNFLHQHLAEAQSQDNTLTEEVSEQLVTALHQLTNKQQEVLYLRFYNQLSFQEIAEIMSVQTRTVYKLAHRSLSTLKHYLSDSLHAFQAILLFVFCQ
uniref:Sigma-70 family RNA polymerase sigma factor n=1 Tax=Roseihalotalea indica TaxID=2867963 RepID=A0AA49GHC2_9BACT|nr:sigma-70 family RNA polymerase sigma factor [Tunicatimonas sp. TK19036]